MNLQELAQIGGVVGVIASLIYVAIQIRNNSRATRAATFQQLSSALASDWLDMSRNPEMISLVLRGSDDFESLNRIEKARMRFFLMGYCRRFENAFFQHKVGTLKDKDWRAEYRNVILNVIREFPDDFNEASPFRNTKNINSKWQNE